MAEPPAKRFAAASMSTKYRWCPHCHLEVAERTYRSHRAMYFPKDSEDLSQTSLTPAADSDVSMLASYSANYKLYFVTRYPLEMKMNRIRLKRYLMISLSCCLKVRTILLMGYRHLNDLSPCLMMKIGHSLILRVRKMLTCNV